MNGIRTRRFPPPWIVLFALASGAARSPAPAAGQALSPGEAISHLGQFQRDVQGLGGIVRRPLGPYGIHTRCTWCSKKFIFCIENTTETWDVDVDFTWTREWLDVTLEEAEWHAGSFSESFAPTRAWLDDLPGFSARFDAAANEVLAVQAEIRGGIGATGTQKARASSALGRLTDSLLTSKARLEEGTRALAAFLQQQSSYRVSIEEAIASSDHSAQTALADLETQSRTHRCQGGLSEKFDEIRRDFTDSVRGMSDGFRRISESSQKAERSLASLLGNVVGSQGEVQNVLESVNAAGNDQLGSFLGKLHLSAAMNQWRDLAAQARAPSMARMSMVRKVAASGKGEGADGYEIAADGVLWKTNVSRECDDCGDGAGKVGLPVAIGVGVIGGGATLAAMARKQAAKSKSNA